MNKSIYRLSYTFHKIFVQWFKYTCTLRRDWFWKLIDFSLKEQQQYIFSEQFFCQYVVIQQEDSK